MPLHKKHLFYLAALVCIALAVAGGIMYPPTPWGVLAPVFYVFITVLTALGILRLVYLKGLPD